MRNAGLEETLDWKKHKLESRVPGEIAITSDKRSTSLCTAGEFLGVEDLSVWEGPHCNSFSLANIFNQSLL